VIAETVDELAPLVGVAEACRTVGLPRASYYRQARPVYTVARPRGGGDQPRALSTDERRRVLDVLHSERFCDQSVEEVYHTLLDEGSYLCSPATMYRLLREAGETRERRRQATHPAAKKPELVATRPNEIWSWDITKIAGPGKWDWYHLYCVIDVFSRFNPAWMVASFESERLAEAMFRDAFRRHGVQPGQLTVHADRGSAMTSKTVSQLLADLQVGQSHSRPHVSNDNPYSEAQFKTLKYRPEFPRRFPTIEAARVFCRQFFDWYNLEHHHAGIGYHTPHSVHHGLADQIDEDRAATLAAAWGAHPERFVRSIPTPPTTPNEAWINNPYSGLHDAAP
jgi:putative transposase